jgi:hypothetical protein
MKKLLYGGRGSIGGVEKQTSFLTFFFSQKSFCPKTRTLLTEEKHNHICTTSMRKVGLL